MKIIMENWRKFLVEESTKCPEKFEFHIKDDQLRRYGGEGFMGLGQKEEPSPITDQELIWLNNCPAAREDLLNWMKAMCNAGECAIPDISPNYFMTPAQKRENFNVFKWLAGSIKDFVNPTKSKTSGQAAPGDGEEATRGTLSITNNTGRRILSIIDKNDPGLNVEEAGYKHILELVPKEDMPALRSAEVRARPNEPMKYSLPFGEYDLDVVFGRFNSRKKRVSIPNGHFHLSEETPNHRVVLNDKPGEEAWRDEYRASSTVQRGLKIGLFNYSGYPLQLLYEGEPLRHIVGQNEQDGVKVYTSTVGHWPWVTRPAPAGESVAVQQEVDWRRAWAGNQANPAPIGPYRMVGLITGREELLDRLEEGQYIELFAQFMTLPDDDGWVRPMREKKRILINPRDEYVVIHATSPGGQQVGTPEGFRDQPWQVTPMDPADAARVIMSGDWDNP
jgi:hypothetical protein